MTTTQQKTRYFEVLPHIAGDYVSGRGTGDDFTVKHVGKVLPESKEPNNSFIFPKRPSVRLATPGYGSRPDRGPVFPLDVLIEVGEFFKGETVWIRPGAKSIQGEVIWGEIAAVVTESERPSYRRRLVRTTSGRMYSLRVEDLSHERSTVTVNLASAAADFTVSIPLTASWTVDESWSPDRATAKAALLFEDIEVDDKVTFRLNRTGEEYTTTAYLEDDEVVFMGWSIGSVDPSDGLTLLRIEKPKPVLPTAPGSIVARKTAYMYAEFHLIGGQWRGARGGYTGDPNGWADGWTLVRDAGADS